MQDVFVNLERTLGPIWPLIAFVLILVLGFIVAKVAQALVRGGLKRTRVDDRIAANAGHATLNTAKIGGKIAFWIVMVLVVITALEAIDLRGVAGPLGGFATTILTFVPKLIGAAILAVVAYVLATILRMLTTRGLEAANLDRRLADLSEPGRPAPPRIATGAPASGLEGPPLEAQRSDAPGTSVSLSQTLGDVVFYLILLLFLPAILGALDLGGILVPIQGLVNEILGFLPNLLLAGVIVVVGAFVAKVIRGIVENLASAAGANALSERVGLNRATGGTSLSSLLGLVVYILVLVPVIVAALQALDVEAVTRPASAMLDQFMMAIPRIFMAAVILGIAFVVGRLVASLVTSLLAGVGFNRMFEGLGFRSASSEIVDAHGQTAASGELDTRTPAGIVGWVVLVAVMLFAATEAANALGLETLGVLIAGFTVLAGQVLLGLIIFAVGLYLANLAYSAVRSSGTQQAQWLAVAARVSILVLAGAMALRQMGLADSIINLAFGLLLGAVAVAAALAFGIGGRDVAREQLEKLVDKAEDGRLTAPRAMEPSHGQPGASPATRPDLTDPTPGT